MRRGILLSIGILEAALACVLIVVGWQLPHPESVEKSFDRVSRVTVNAETQVRLMREQIEEIRLRDFPKVVTQLRAQSRVFSTKLGDSPSDSPSVHSMNDAVLAYAIGLENWSAALGDDRILSENQRQGLGDDPSTESLTRRTLFAFRTVEQLAAQLDNDCRGLYAVCGAPMDAGMLIRSVAKVVHINELLIRFANSVAEKRLDDLREAGAELESTLEAAYRQVDLASSASIPLLMPNGTQQPIVQMVPLWPEGKQAARGIRSALTAVKATNRQLDAFARWAESPPEARVKPQTLFQVTQRIRSIAVGVRQTLDGLERVLARWSAITHTARTMGQVLLESRRQVDDGSSQRSEYERAVRGSRQATESAEDLLRSYSTLLNARLSEQERSLAQMELGLGDVGESIPAVSHTTCDLLDAIRWMFWLVGWLLALHGAFVICEACPRVRVPVCETAAQENKGGDESEPPA